MWLFYSEPAEGEEKTANEEKKANENKIEKDLE